MFGVINFGAFLIEELILNLTPGADYIYPWTKYFSREKSRYFICFGNKTYFNEEIIVANRSLKLK